MSSFSRPSFFPAISAEVPVSPVMLPPGRARLEMSPSASGSNTFTKTIGTVVVAFLAATAAGEDEARMTSIDLQSHQLVGKLRQLIEAPDGGSKLDDHILAVDVSPLP
jgi:hypothetical protein